MNEQIQEQLTVIADHFGLDSQLNKTKEESAELIQAISKVKIEGFTPRRLSGFIEEIADVEIMIEQLKYLVGQGIYVNIDGAVESVKLEKIARTLDKYDIGGVMNE